MECGHCKSSWNSSLAVTNCLFCGKYILNDTSDNMTLPEGISSIVAEYGIEILNDSKRFISLIMNYVRDKIESLVFCGIGIPVVVTIISLLVDLVIWVIKLF